MRIALISDIHGNMIALEAVLAEINRNRPDHIVCLGDVATLGPHPRDVIDAVRTLGCPCIMGNHDEFLIDPQLVHSYNMMPIVVDSIEWCQNQLSESELGFLATFTRTLRVPLNSSETLLLFHGSPRSHMEVLLATTPADEVDVLLAGHSADIMAGGHTHIQMIRQHRGRILLNPGSVGLPFKEHVTGQYATFMAHAEYATIDVVGNTIGIAAHRIPLDKSLLLEAVAKTDNPLRNVLLRQYD
jgi:predicted phosphodiesterase